jgi:RNA recognition motif-containing protein
MGKTVYVGNMSYEITAGRLKELFAAYGEVLEVRVIKDHFTGRLRGFAFVDMATEEAARTAISELNGLTVDDRQLKVAEARSRKQRAPAAYTYSDHRS